MHQSVVGSIKKFHTEFFQKQTDTKSRPPLFPVTLHRQLILWFLDFVLKMNTELDDADLKSLMIQM